jgi:mannose-6-phosphate isomerase-like protein (cupin superfamily)
LDGQSEVLTGDSVLTATDGDLIVVPPKQVHAFGTPRARTAELLIVQHPAWNGSGPSG